MAGRVGFFRLVRALEWRLARALKHMARSYYTGLARSTVARCGQKLHVNGRTRLTPETYLGENVHMNGLEISGHGEVRIGSNFHSGPGCLFITENHNYDSGEELPYDGSSHAGSITIGDNVWLGSRVIVLGGVTIAEGAIVQAGSCVVSDVPRCAVVGGHPARVFKYRDIEHYERLLAAKKFH